MGQIYVKASRRAKAHKRRSPVFSAVRKAIKAAEAYYAEANSSAINPSNLQRKMTLRHTLAHKAFKTTYPERKSTELDFRMGSIMSKRSRRRRLRS